MAQAEDHVVSSWTATKAKRSLAQGSYRTNAQWETQADIARTYGVDATTAGWIVRQPEGAAIAECASLARPFGRDA
jgi:hypothetical protein